MILGFKNSEEYRAHWDSQSLWWRIKNRVWWRLDEIYSALVGRNGPQWYLFISSIPEMRDALYAEIRADHEKRILENMDAATTDSVLAKRDLEMRARAFEEASDYLGHRAASRFRVALEHMLVAGDWLKERAEDIRAGSDEGGDECLKVNGSNLLRKASRC